MDILSLFNNLFPSFSPKSKNNKNRKEEVYRRRIELEESRSKNNDVDNELNKDF